MAREPAHAMAYLSDRAINVVNQARTVGAQFAMYGGSVDRDTYEVKTDIIAEVSFSICRPNGLVQEFAFFLEELRSHHVEGSLFELRVDDTAEDGTPKKGILVTIRCAYSYSAVFWKLVEQNFAFLTALIRCDERYLLLSASNVLRLYDVATWMAYYQNNGKLGIRTRKAELTRTDGLLSTSDTTYSLDLCLAEPDMLDRIDVNDQSKICQFLESLGKLKQSLFPENPVSWGANSKNTPVWLTSNIEYRTDESGKFIGFKYMSDYRLVMAGISKGGYVSLQGSTGDRY